MPNVNNSEYIKLYELYPNKPTQGFSQSDIAKKIESIGRCIGKGYGSHHRKV